jgi:hypothetical protein
MAKQTLEQSEPTAQTEHHDPWAGAAADAYIPKTTGIRNGTITEAGLAPAGPWCNPGLPPMSHDQLMQSWGLPSSSLIHPSPMPEHLPADGFTGNLNPGQPGRNHPDPIIQPCEGEPLTS